MAVARLIPTRAASSAADHADSAAQFSPPVPFYRYSRPRDGASACAEPRKTRRSSWHRGCRGTVDPPFGGLWCDQPALFLSPFRRPAPCTGTRDDRVRPCGPGSGPDDSLAHGCRVVSLLAGGAPGGGPGSIGDWLSGSGGLKLLPMMNGAQQAAIHQALISVQSAVTEMTFPRCDQEDLLELIDRVEEQLHVSHPNAGLMCTFLNSIARSLRAQPEAREACLTIEQAIEAAGMPSTWQSGI